MSAVPIVEPSDLPRSRIAARPRRRVWVRALSFTLLALYGVERWGRLERDPPGWRLFGLAALAVALAVFVPLVRHLTARWPGVLGRVVTGLATLALGLATLPVAGLRWQWVIHGRVAECARAIGSGLGALGNVLVPYLGRDYSIRLVMMLGAAVLLVDAAAALAYAPREISGGRRAAAALPLIALAVVPATLVPPRYPALQGLLLFLLLAAFLWGEEIPRDSAAAALGVACAAGIVATVAGPLISSSQAWVNYRAWAGSSPGALAESFDWNQSYGPLDWPQDGRIVLQVEARRAEYWTAEDLTDFNGTDWVASSADTDQALPAPSPAAVHRYSERIAVTLEEIKTDDVIGATAPGAARPSVAGGVSPGDAPGTWVADQQLGPGASYAAENYSPAPSAGQLSRPGHYPWAALAPDLTLTLPTARGTHPRSQTFAFPAFHRPLPAATSAALAGSPYAPALSLARRLAARAATPAAFIAAVKAYLAGGNFVYTQATTQTQYPLLTFLFETGTGYCQQFSGSMAMLLRMGGIPARVAAGFTPGVGTRTSHSFTVSDLDAHAWVEAWFPRYGWVTFDPTPSSAPALGGSGNSSQSALNGLRARRAVGSAGDVHQVPKVHPAGTIGQSNGKVTAPRATRRARSEGGWWPWVGIGAGLLAVALLGLGTIVLRRTRRRVDPVDELQQALARTGQPLRDGTTLAALERRLDGSPEAAGYVRALRLSRYGAGVEPPAPGGRRALRQALSAGLGVRGRLRAWWALPPGAGPRPL